MSMKDMTLPDFVEWVNTETDYGPDWEPPTRVIVCPQCHGKGVSTAYLGAYTQSDREEMGEEWFDFMDDVRNGVYDRTCDQCHGRNVVEEMNEEALPSDLLAAWVSWVHDMYEMAHMEAMERRMGA